MKSVLDGWGPLSHPIRDEVPTGAPPWRDNAYMAFWTSDLSAFGCYHVSTSPNAKGRRARFSLMVGGSAVEIVEEIEPGTFNSPSLEFDLGDSLRVRSAQVSGELVCTPLFELADYSDKIIPGLDGGVSLTHYQRTGRFVGRFIVGGTEFGIDGVGIRDRTWGSRDESVSISEYIGIMAVLDGCAITAIRMRAPNGTDRTEGFVLYEGGKRPIVGLDEIRRDAQGLFSSCELTLADGDTMVLRNTRRAGGFWVPMGWERKGPVMSAYDEYDSVMATGMGSGAAMIEQGVLRTL
jgi:hypothetical protein